MLATPELWGQVYLCMKRQWFMLALQELPHRDGAAASLSLCYAACAVRCASHGWAVSQWLAARPACPRVCVPACPRVWSRRSYMPGRMWRKFCFIKYEARPPLSVLRCGRADKNGGGVCRRLVSAQGGAKAAPCGSQAGPAHAFLVCLDVVDAKVLLGESNTGFY